MERGMLASAHEADEVGVLYRARSSPSIEFLVIDEANRMLDTGYAGQIRCLARREAREAASGDPPAQRNVKNARSSGRPAGANATARRWRTAQPLSRSSAKDWAGPPG